MPSLGRTSTILISLEAIDTTVEIRRQWNNLGHLQVRVRCILDETGTILSEILLDPPLDSREQDRSKSALGKIDESAVGNAISNLTLEDLSSMRPIKPDDPYATRNEQAFTIKGQALVFVAQENLLGFRFVFLKVRRFWKPTQVATVAGFIGLARFGDEEDDFPLFLTGEFMITS